MEVLMHWNWNNFKTTPQRWMAYYLQRCGWVAFYADFDNLRCDGSFCWLNCYLDGEAAAARERGSDGL